MIREMRQSLHHVVAFIHPTTVGIELGVGAINERFNQNLPATCQRPNLWLVEVHTASCCAAYVKVIVLVEGFDDTTCFFNCLEILVNEHFCLLVLEDFVDTFQILPWPFSVRPHVDVPKGTTFQIPDGWKRGGTTSHPTAVIGLKDFSEPFLELCLVPGDFALHLPQFFFHFLGIRRETSHYSHYSWSYSPGKRNYQEDACDIVWQAKRSPFLAKKPGHFECGTTSVRNQRHSSGS